LAGSHAYVIKSSGEPLLVEPLDSHSLNPGVHFKDMTGWNRKAIAVHVPATRPDETRLVELLDRYREEALAP